MARRVVSAQEFHSVVMDATFGPKAMSAQLAAIAKRKLAEVEARQGVFPYRRKVDGVMDAQETSVKPNGKISYFIEAYKLVFDELFNMLLQRSPVSSKALHGEWGNRKKTDGYRDIHYNQAWVLLINYTEVHSFTEGKARTPKPGEVWTLVNIMPYSRRLAKGWSVSAPDGWIEIIAATFNAKYANFLVQGSKVGKRTIGKGCRYEYITPPPAAFTLAGVRGPNAEGKPWLNDSRYPAISIEIPNNAMTGGVML